MVQRTLDHFFVDSATPSRKRKAEALTPNKLESSQQPTISGLSIIPNFVNPQDEKYLLDYLCTQSWRTDLSRRCIHYGGTYCLLPPRSASPNTRARIEKDIKTASPMPEEFQFLIDKMVELGLYPREQQPQFCIVNEYTGTQGISAHVENFRFAEPVCALTLGDGDWMRFHELLEEDDGSVRSGRAQVAKRTGRKNDVWLGERSLLVMKGEARRKWQHEIVRRKKRTKSGFRRVSLTFRLEVVDLQVRKA